jgi:hypothetical protein
MTRYKNLSGDSGVVGYDLGPDSITVHFRNGAAYLYNHAIPGPLHVEHMKSLAIAGRGLSSYISQVVKTRYAHKLR